VEADNPFVALQENVSRQIVAALDGWRGMSETLAERTFLTIYGWPSLQNAVGVDPAATRPLRKAAKSSLHHELRSGLSSSSRASQLVGCAKRSSADFCTRVWRGQQLMSGDLNSLATFARHTVICPSETSRRWCASSSICC
jgi:Protein of unknown function (DUF3141)